ncbi:MAG TPA: protein kinase [Acidimicrobiales bacterium]|nr:protein kinase [Acidimicrobiales bacterium]
MTGECAADQLLGGRYTLVEVLGHGASGVVWRARDQLLHRDVAVKEIRSPLVVGHAEDAGFRESILREARAAARLNHSGAVTVYDVVEDEGRPLIVMELVDAPTLAELVESGGPLAPPDAAAVGLELLDALDAGHEAGIVHRDVKPRNVMVAPGGRVRLADFGVAAVIDDVRMTTGNVLIGSPAYMAPEQVIGEEIGPAADMWALGATLYFAVEGRPPFDKGSVIPTMTAIVRESPRPPERAGRLAPVLEALLAKDPATRPAAPFLRLWLSSLAGGEATAWSNDLDSTSQFKSGQFKSGQFKSGQFESGQFKSGQFKSGQFESGQVESGQVEPGQVESGQVEPGQGEGPPGTVGVSDGAGPQGRPGIEDIEVPGPSEAPGGPLVPGPIGPDGPDVVVIPKPSTTGPPPAGPIVPMPTPGPETTPTPDPGPATQPVPAPPAEPGPVPEQVPPSPEPERVPPEPVPTPPAQPGPIPTPEPVRPDPDPGPVPAPPAQPAPAPAPEQVPPSPAPDPLRVAPESDPLQVPSEPDPLRAPTERVAGLQVGASRETLPAAGQTMAGQTMAGQTMAGQTMAGQTMAGQTMAGQTMAGQTMADQTVGRAAAGRTAAGRAGRSSADSGRRRLGALPLVAMAALVVVALVAALQAGRGGGGAGQGADPQSDSSGATRTPATRTASANVPGDWVPYADPITGFTISHPPGWDVIVDGTLTDFRDPATGAYLRVDHVEPPGPSPEGAWFEFEPRFAADHPGYERIRIEPTTYAGFPAAAWEYTYGGGGFRLRAVNLGFVTDRYGFALNFQTPGAEWDRLRPAFEAFKASFRAPSP